MTLSAAQPSAMAVSGGLWQPRLGAATMLEVLDRIHRDQQQRGRKPMTEEEMAAEIAQSRAEDEEYEERWRQIWSQTRTQAHEGG
jgi:hypothetical protein